jgi:hypothetical protein
MRQREFSLDWNPKSVMTTLYSLRDEQAPSVFVNFRVETLKLAADA